MFRGGDWFAWYPVQARGRSGPRWVWLEYVWRDQTYNKNGSVAANRYYTQ